MSSVCEICANKCFGIEDYDGSCCKLENRDFIIGRITDSEDFLERLNYKLGRNFLWNEIFIGFEEGKNLFPEKSVWQNPENFPAMRIDTSNSSFPCIFYNVHGKFCSVHDVRPLTCQEYFCDYLANEIGETRTEPQETKPEPENINPFIT